MVFALALPRLAAQEQPLAAASVEYPEVLILNSYSPGYNWSAEAMTGMLDVLKLRYQGIEPIIQFLDCKRFSDPVREPWLIEDIVYKCTRRPPKLIITLDDPAFDFALKYRERLGASIPIVFGGVNHFRPEMIKGQASITGVSEETDYHGTFELIRCLKPETTKILLISNQTKSGLEASAAMEPIIRQYTGIYQFELYDNWTNQELIEKVSTLPEGTVGFIVDAIFDRTGHANYNDHAFSEALANRSSVPLFINSRPPGKLDWSLHAWDGIGGGLVVAELHGMKVGELALRVLSGESADSIPVLMHTPERIEVDYRHLVRFGLSNKSLPAGAVVVNAPSNFYQIHRSWIIQIGVLFLILCGAVVALFINVLRRRKAESDLQLLATAVSQASDLILILATNGRLRYANPTLTRLSGRELAVAKSQNFDEFWSPNGENASFKTISARIAAEGTWAGVFELLAADKHLRKLQVQISPLRNEAGVIVHYLFTARDCTLEHKLEEQLQSSQKLEAVGLLAGGVAHDFNNILQLIKGYGSMLQADSSNPEELKEGLTVINEAAERATQLTRQLLLFSRRQRISRQDVDANQLVSEFLKMIVRLIGEHVELQFKPLAEPFIIQVDRGQLEQVLMNLCVNARDAMPGGGRIVIELSRKDFSEQDIVDWPELKPGAHLELKVQDTGCGMPPEVVSHVFEPFFTTKPYGKGTGLGLSVVFGIIQQHQGAIRVYSEPGRGAVFKIFLPVLEGSSSKASGEASEQVLGPGHGLILMAEDDLQVQNLAKRILTQNGFDVITAADGQLAEALVEKYHAELRLVLLDVVMPKRSGRMVYDFIKAKYPGLPVLLCSGYSSELLPSDLVPESDLTLLHKPYTSMELLRMVHRLLDKEN